MRFVPVFGLALGIAAVAACSSSSRGGGRSVDSGPGEAAVFEAGPPPAFDAAVADGSSADATLDALPEGGEDAGVSMDAGVKDAPVEDADAQAKDAGVIDSGAADMGASDAGADAGSVGSLWAGPGLPPFDAATIAHVQAVRAVGVQRGNHPSVFAKVGDSITAYPEFLLAVGSGGAVLGSYGALAATISYFTATTLADGSNSFTRQSQCAVPGWTTTDALASGGVPAELAALKPMYAVMMFGTNDSQTVTLPTYTSNMNKLVDMIEANGTVVLLSKIPPRTDYANADADIAPFNAAIVQIAQTRHLPLVDLYAALEPLPAQGIGSDGVHPSVEMVGGQEKTADFTSAGLEYGFDVRNLLTVEILDRTRQLP